MPAKHHSRSEKMAAVALARQAGAEQAGVAMGIDPRTVAGWVKTVEIPDSEWGAVEQTLLARGVEMTARGITSGLVATLTAAGISSRNRRYEQLIARREARREAEQEPEAVEPPWLVLVEGFDAPRGALVGAEVRAAFMDRIDTSEPEPSDQDDARFLAWIESVAALTDDQVRERLLELEPGWSEHFGWQSAGVAGLRAAIDAIDGPAGDGVLPATAVDSSPAVTLVEDGTPMTSDPPEAPPGPRGPSQRPPQPSTRGNVGLHVVSDAEASEYDDQRHLWHPYDR